MNSLKSTQDIVSLILRENPMTRNSDQLLYSEVCKYVNPNIKEISFCYALENMKELGLPVFETVRRSRQKIQSIHPELGSSSSIKNFRKEKEVIFKEYAHSSAV